MKIIEIAPLINGAHRNQTYNGFVPDGWALMPDDLTAESFPFGAVEAEEIDGTMTVTAWTAGTIPEPEPQPEPEPSMADRMTAVEDAIEILLSGRAE